MYNVSQDYLDYINNDANVGRFSKNKVVIDGIAYLSDTLKSNPKISHKATNLIGGFPAKTCNFEILNTDGTLILNNKEITVYKGLDIDGSTEWVQMGIFSARDEDITTDQTTKSISFSGTDRTTLFDVVYTSSLDWTTSHTGLEIIQEVCNLVDVTLETTNFAFSTHVFTEKPNFAENITFREVVSRIAEIGGEIAYISRIGGLKIVGQNTTGQTVGKSKREKITKESEFKINTVVLGKEGIDDDIVYQDQSLIDAPKTRNVLDYNNITKSTSSSSTDDPARRGTLETHPGGFKYTASEAHGNCFIAQYIFEGTGDVFLKGDTVDRSIRAYVYSNNLWGTQIKNFSLATGSTFNVNGRAVIGFYYSSTGAGDVVDVYDLQLEFGTSGTPYIEYSTWGIQEWRIEDNPYVDLIRESIIAEVASHIIETSVIPFSLSGFIDDYIYDLNDVINVTDNNGDTFAAVMLEYETQSRIKSNIAASAKTEATTNYQIAGSVKQEINKVQLQVNHNTGEIASLATRTGEIEGQIGEIQTNTTQIIQNAEQVIIDALREYVTTGELETFRTSVSTQFQQTADAFNFNFSNLITQINNLDSDTQEQFTEIIKYIRFINGVIELGEVGNPIILKIEHDEVAFYQDNNKVAYLSNSKMLITDAEIINSLTIGNFTWKPRENGNLSLVFTGGGN